MSQPVGGSGRCVALLELSSIAAGFEVVDALSKQAEIELLQSGAVSPGKYIVLFTGPVEDVRSSWQRGAEVGADVLLDKLFIPNLEPTLLDLVAGRTPPAGELDAVGIIETLSVASTIRAADIAAKTASLRLVSLRLAAGIGGKSYITFTGEVGDVGVALDAGAADAQAANMLVRRVLIPRPHGVMGGVLSG